MKRILFCLILLSVAALAGCAKTEKADGYRIYATNAERDRLQTETFSASDAQTDEIVQEMLDRICTPLMNTENYSVIPENVEITEYSLTDGQLTVTFGDDYRKLGRSDEMLLRAGVVFTMVQLPEVRTVVFHIGDDVLRDSAGEPVGAMTGGMFLNSQIGKNSYQYASLALYFANRSGDRIVRETRNIHYSSNTTLEKVAMEQLIKGPRNEQLNPILPEGVTVLDITVEDRVCTLNLSKEFLDVRSDETLTPEVAIYAIVDTLCDVLRVEQVQFQVEGQSNVLFKQKLSLDGPFHRNSDLIEVQDAQPEGGSQPAVGL